MKAGAYYYLVIGCIHKLLLMGWGCMPSMSVLINDSETLGSWVVAKAFYLVNRAHTRILNREAFVEFNSFLFNLGFLSFLRLHNVFLVINNWCSLLPVSPPHIDHFRPWHDVVIVIRTAHDEARSLVLALGVVLLDELPRRRARQDGAGH